MRAVRAERGPEGFFDEVARLMGADDPRVTLLGPVCDAEAHIRRRAPVVRTRVWNMQVNSTTNQVRSSRTTSRQYAGPGFESRALLPLGSPHTSPLYAFSGDVVRLGRVPAPMLLTDDEHVFLAGPSGTALGSTIWESTDPEVVAAARHAYLASWEAARPWQELDERPPLPERRCEVALLLADGSSDAEIAAALGVSTRTASSEVRAVTEWLGARSRGHAIARLSGAAG